MPQIYRLNTLLLRCCLFCFSLCLSSNFLVLSEPLRFQTDKAAFEQGGVATAYKTFHTLVLPQPGDPRIIFYSGAGLLLVSLEKLVERL